MAFLLFRFFNLRIKFDLCKNAKYPWMKIIIQHLYINLKLFLETYVFNICFFVIYQCILVIFSLLVFSTLRFFLFQESVGTPSNQPNHNQHNHSENGKYPPIRNETILLKMVLIYYPKIKDAVSQVRNISKELPCWNVSLFGKYVSIFDDFFLDHLWWLLDLI